MRKRGKKAREGAGEEKGKESEGWSGGGEGERRRGMERGREERGEGAGEGATRRGGGRRARGRRGDPPGPVQGWYGARGRGRRGREMTTCVSVECSIMWCNSIRHAYAGFGGGWVGG